MNGWPSLISARLLALDAAQLASRIIRRIPVPSRLSAALHAGPSSELLSFEARHVRSDGTMDLTAPYHPSLEYTFIRRNPDAEPVPAGAPSKAFERIDVTVNEPKG